LYSGLSVTTRSTSTYYEAEPKQSTGASVLGVLRRRILLVLMTILLCGAAAAAFAYSAADRYESTARLVFQQTVGPELRALGLLPNTPDAQNLSADNVAVVGSRRVAVAAAAELRRTGRDVTAEDVVDDVKVSSPKDSDIVDIVASASSKREAALLANVYADSAVAIARRDERARVDRAVFALKRQLDRLAPRDRDDIPGARLRSRIQQMRALGLTGTGSPSIVQPGYIPTDKASSPLRTVVLGCLFGAILGAGLALLREQADRRLHGADQVSAAFDAPVLTTVPRDRALKRHVPFRDLRFETAEAFRMLQMNLRFGRRDPVRSVLVTSARSEEGKTTIAWNLACAAASAGLSVALVEADLRRMCLAERYDLHFEPGLAEVLEGEVELSQALQRVTLIPPHDARNGNARAFDVIVGGSPSTDPWALLQYARTAELLGVLKERHDLVVVDTPPIAHVSDAISLLHDVDGVLLAATVSSTRDPEARRLRDQLDELGAKVLGVVANGGSAQSGYGYAGSSDRAHAAEPAV
jgi:tyrosine-protein kinase